jgi:hypothetical protein
MSHAVALLLLALPLAAALASAAEAQELGFDGFEFTIPYDGLVEGTAPADLAKLDAPAGADGFVQVRGDDFVLSASGEPIRFWATNLSIEGCFPPHDVADRMARRVATLGVNCVRMHFMDAAGWPRGIWDSEGWGDFPHRRLHPDALDRLDYLIAKLKENGVYTNINLHVARAWSPQDGFPEVGDGENAPQLGKGIGFFHPKAIEEQKRYARMLMGHVNAYTGNAYAQEPAIAMVEITNENGLLMVWFGTAGGLDDLPQPYMDELRQRFNAWLRGRYDSTGELRATWAEGEVAGSDRSLLAPGPELQVAGSAAAELGEETDADGAAIYTVRVSESGDQAWHTQLLWRPFAVEEGVAYALRLRMRANRQKTAYVGVARDHDPWGSLGLWQEVTVGPEWRDYEFFLTSPATDRPEVEGGARVSVSGLADAGLELSVAGVSLKPAAIVGLPKGEALGNVAWTRYREWGSRTEAVRLDILRFLRDAEVGFYKDMVACLKDDVGCRMPITGTAAGNTPSHLAAETVDYLDGHNYWQHPHFPRRPWDPEDWVVPNRAMVNDPAGSTIGGLAGRRVFGLPFTVSEYNHPAPGDYRAEGFPLIAVFGSLQDWDGVFTYTYAHRDFEVDHFFTFFDLKGDPLRLAAQPACSDILRHHRIPSGTEPLAVDMPLEARLGYMLAGRPWQFAPSAFSSGADPLSWQARPVGFRVEGRDPDLSSGPAADVSWEVGTDGRGCVTYVSPACAGLIGFAAGRTLRAGPIWIEPATTSLDGFSTVMVNAVDGQDLGEPGRYLITAMARAENIGMGWNDDRSSVGSRWGTGPTLCEGVKAELRIGGDYLMRVMQVYALNPDGTRRGERLMPASTPPGVFHVRLEPRYRTLWYELVLGE